MKTSFLKYTVLLVAFLWSGINLFAQSESAINILSQPKYERQCADSSSTLSVIAEGNSLSYQWYRNTGQGFQILEENNQFSGVETADLQISEIDESMNMQQFICAISNGTENVVTQFVAIKLLDLRINKQPTSQTVFQAENTTFALHASGDNISYQWQQSTGAGFSDIADGKRVSGTQTDRLILRDINADLQGARYRCVVTGGDICAAKTLISEEVSLTVKEGENAAKSMNILASDPIFVNKGSQIIFNGSPVMRVNGSVQNENPEGQTLILGQGRWGSNATEIGATVEVNGSWRNLDEQNPLFNPNDKTRVKFIGTGVDEAVYLVPFGNDNSSPSADYANNFHIMEIDRAGGNFYMEAPNTSVNRHLQFTEGTLDLISADLELKNIDPVLTTPSAACQDNEMPTIIDENDNNRIIGNNEVFMADVGVTIGTASCPNPFTQAGGYNLGNMGLNIQTDATNALGGDMLTIRRGHLSTTINGNSSIAKYWKIIRQNTTNTAIDITASFFTPEATGQDTDNLDFYYNPNTGGTGTFTNQGASTNTPNAAALNPVTTLAGTWTLQTCIAPEVTLSPGYNFEMCPNADPVTLTANITSGTAASYLWQLGVFDPNVGDIVFTTIPGETSSTITVDYNDDPTGVGEYYKVIVENAQGCKGEISALFSHYPPINIDWSGLPTVQCDLTPFTFDADWGNAGAGYDWYVNGNLQTSETAATFDFTPPAGGTYEISVTTGIFVEGGFICPETFTHTITFSEESLEVTFPYAFNEIDVCEAEGSFTIEPNLDPIDDGTYTYSWTLNGTEVGTNPTYTVNFDAAIESETYQLTVTTGVGCTDEESVIVYHTESADVDWSALPTTSCTLDPFTFNAGWGNEGAGFQWNVNDEIQTGETDSIFVFTPPAAGTYTITVITGEYGSIQYCPEQFTHTITFADGEQLADLPFTMSACDVEGGLTPINLETPACTDCTYQWFDANDNPVGTNSNTYTVPDLTENTSFSVEVTKDGCTSSDEVQLFYYFATIDEEATVITNLGCDGAPTGAIDLVFDATEAGYASFSWENVNTADTYFTEDLSGLAAGTYSVTMTDDINGCSDTATFVVGGGGETVTATSVVLQPSCFGDDNGSITLTPSGGTGTYTYAWSHGPTTIAVSDLAPDTYTVTVSDGNECEYIESFNIIEPVVLAIDLAKTDLNCAGGTDGTITVTTTGGTEPYTYVWSANANNPTDPENLTGLSAGTYTVTVTDDRDCEAITGITIEEPANAITANFDSTTEGISCNNANDGFISINASGGTGDLTYDWNVDIYDGMSEVDNLPAGMYSISVSDANGCPPVILEITFENPAALTLSEITTNPSAAGAMDGSIDITVEGGTPNYNFDWADVPGLDNDEDRTGLGAGTYTVVITDENNCEIMQQYQLTEPGQLSVVVENITNISCEGTDDGTIDITVNGGVAPYTFLWSNGDETEDLSNVPAGDYTVMITDDNGIEFNSLTYTVNPPNFLTDNAIITQIDCSDETGIIALSPTNGTGDYTYAWEHGPTTATVSDLAAGDYMVTISTDNDCPFVGTYTINAAPTGISVTGSVSGVCAGSIDGTIEIDVTGGTPDYSFVWTNTADNSTVALTEDVMNLPAGDYQVEVTDDNNCVATFDFNIPEYPSLDGTANVTDVSAGGATDGAIDLTITGGTEEFTFAWSDGDVFMADTEDISDLSVGTYIVLVTDANGCTFTASYTVNEPGALDIALNITQEIDCFGDETGQITATIGGGTEPYTYAWSNGGDTNPLTDLPAGTYTLTATDAAGIVTVSNPITIGEPTEFTINAQVTNPTTAGGNDGSILTAPSGGESPYTFNWSDGTDTYSTSSLNDIGAGNYDLTVTDANGCVATDALATYTLTDPNVLAISLTASQNVSCPEGVDGSLTVNASGGVEEYTYNWENATNPGTSIGATATIDALEAGTYNVTATDADGLMTSSSFDITQPEALVYNELINNVLCDNPMSGSITLAPTGGTGTYAYLWSNEATTASITDLIAGDYTVTITDENDCTYTETFSVTPASLISAEETIVDVNCNSDNTGSINLAPQGGGGTYTYLWSNEATTQNISQLTAGEYSVTISDGGECEFIETYTIDEPTALTASTTTMQASQPTTADGSIDLTVMGGTGEYSFLWSNTETTEDLGNILAGTYTVTITDENECEIVETVSVTSPGGISVIPTATQITCFGLDNGSISLEIEGGTMPFTILWSNDETMETISDLAAGVYTATVTDNTGFSINTSAEIIEPAEFSLTATPTGVACNGDANGSINITTNNGQADFDFVWSNEATTQNISGLESGVYMVTATDDNGCVATQTATVSTPNPLVLTEDIIENPECWDDTNGTIFLSTMGGTGDYEYIWSNGDMTEDIINLSADTYLVTVTDENNCTAEMSYDVTAPLPILITLDETNITCGGATVGSVTATVTGGTTASGDYDLMWSNSETTLTITDLTAGTYTLTAEDDNGCTSVESATITQTGSLVLSEMQENISCFGEEDGLILVQVVGSGTAPFDYLWSDGQMTDLATGLAAQDYTVTVTDAEGCEGIETYIISQPTPMIGTLDAIAASCFDSENGAIEVSISGGTLDTGSDYAYAWSNSATTEDLENLPAGEYTVTITDDNDCQLIETETVSSPDELVINAIQGGTDCGNTDNISITLEVMGGTPDYIYNWDNGATTAIVENLAEGTYMATVTDDNGCTQSIEQTVSQPTPIVADAFIQRAGCKTANDGLIDVTTMGGLAPYDFAWSNGSFEEDIMGLSAGNYTLTVTDATNCVHEMNFEVEIAPEPFAVNFLVNSGLSDTDTLQVNSSDIVQFIDVSLPTPTAWEWSFGDPNNSTSTEQNPQFSYPFDEDMEQTEYMASLVASNEYCRDTITKTILIINNFRPNLPEFDPGENVRFLNVNAYPNPTDDVINLDIEMSKDTEVKVQIVDVLGRVHEERTLTEDDTYNAQFSMKHLTNGVYYVHLSSADRKVTLGVVKVD